MYLTFHLFFFHFTVNYCVVMPKYELLKGSGKWSIWIESFFFLQLLLCYYLVHEILWWLWQGMLHFARFLITTRKFLPHEKEPSHAQLIRVCIIPLNNLSFDVSRLRWFMYIFTEMMMWAKWRLLTFQHFIVKHTLVRILSLANYSFGESVFFKMLMKEDPLQEHSSDIFPGIARKNQ